MIDTQLRYAKTIIVPIARPDTAPHMLELATSLIDPKEGRVIALTVNTENENSRTAETVAACTPIIEQFQEEGYKLEFVAQPAGSITRGILDATREYGAEMLIIGVHQATHREVKLGSVVENIVQAATCDVLVYRLGKTPKFDRVVVTLDGRNRNITALNRAVVIAKTRGIPLSPLYVQRDYIYREDHEQAQNTLMVQHDTGSIHKEIIPGAYPAERILLSMDEDDLLVMGFQQKSELDSQLVNNLADVLLNRAPGPVLLVSRLYEEENRLMEGVQRQLQRFNPALTSGERNELLWQAQKTALGGIDYDAMILLSALLASLGLLLNSVAVIIGAMLVAPLMTPLSSLAMGLVTSRLPITRRSFTTLVEGVGLALVISVIAGLLLPGDTPTDEMLLRGNPTLIDAAVAFVSGLVAAYATARKEIPAALAGVAIAAALMPPLCTVGLAIAFQEVQLAFGSGLLFLANILFIIAAEYIIFFWLGMRPLNPADQQSKLSTRLLLTAIGAMGVVVVVVLVALGLRAIDEASIVSYMQEQIPDAQYTSLETERDNGVLTIIYTARSIHSIAPERIDQAEAGLANLLGEPVELEVVSLQIVRPQSQVRSTLIDYLEANLPGVSLVDYNVEEIPVGDEEDEATNTLLVEAVWRSANGITPEQVRDAENVLNATLEETVSLTVIVQDVVRAGVSSPTHKNTDSETDASQ
ncbi:DUF389 domain-containing protein [Phototrophicus methaneseepsis]|uniref:DUF389 domain-containing protein n=1 Tax=Phototrophicus methaneseepsis TaxID=2710758 RepID=A0A7S8EC65_9CHLR|nr:DUF389 domain-containing protein [Phototrophicus methaneseepsis]QPC84234.1 DUF389 domain-containing protein [Phototrophicus methaneseepsis]